MRFWWFLLLSLSTSYAVVAQAREYRINHRQINVEDGLSQREVLSLCEDRQGFMWVGTRSGLNFYDGHAFTGYNRTENGLGLDTIQVLAEDTEGWLWLFKREKGQGNLCFFQVERREIQSCAQRFGARMPFAPGALQKIHTRPDGSVLLVLDDGRCWTYDATGFHGLTIPSGTALVKVLPSGRLLCRNQTTFALAAADGHLLGWLPAPPGIAVDYFEYGPDTWLVLTSDGGLHGLRTAPGALPRWRYGVYRLPEQLDAVPETKITVHARDQTIFLANRVSLTILAPLDSQAVHVRVLYQQALERNILAISIDRQGTAWVATENGLHLFRVEPALFTQYLMQEIEAGGKRQQANCRGIAQGINGSLYLALNDASLVTFNPADGKARLLPGPRDAWALTTAPDGTLWSANKTVQEYTPEGQLRRVFRMANDSAQTWSIAPAGPQRWWLGLEAGLAELDPGASPAIRPFSRLNGFAELPRSRILQIVPADQSSWWLATSSGLYRLDARVGITERYWPGGQGRFYLPAANIQYLHRDAQGVYWLATGGEGLLRWTPEEATPTLRQFTRRDGLSSNNLYAIFEDERHFLWISSGYGIIRFHPATSSSQVFLPADGLSHYEFNRISAYQSPEGRIYFGSLNGITAFYPADFAENPSYGVPLTISRAQRYDARRETFVDLTTAVRATGSLDLPSDSRLFTLSFALQDYFYAPQTVYEYALDGEPGWVVLEGNQLRLSGLAYGERLLRVRARGAQGRYSDQELRLLIHVAYPLYQRWWFMCGLVVLTGAGGWAGLRWRTRRLLRRQRELEQAVAERTEKIEAQAAELQQLDALKSRFFANISHELRTPLTLISGPATQLVVNHRTLSAEEREQSLRLMLRNSDRLLVLVEELLELSRLDARQVKLARRPVDFEVFCRRVFGTFEAQAQLKNIHYTLQYALEPGLYQNIDAGRLEKIVGNLLHNALQHTGANGRVTLQVTREGQQLCLAVADTGTGIHPDDLPHVFDRYFQSKRRETPYAGGSGIGLALAHELAILMDGSLEVSSRWQAGSVFTLCLPDAATAAEAPATTGEGEAEKPLFVENALPVALPEQGSAITLLVVEDNADMQLYLKSILSPQYRLVCASNGREAWDWLENETEAVRDLSLILSDVMMPEMDGFELLARIKSHDRWRRLPLVLLTARSEAADRLHGLRLGVDDYLTKPFSPDELLARTANLLAHYHERQSVAPQEPALLSADDRWLQELETLVRESLERKEALSVPQLAGQLSLSERSLYRRVKQLTGLSPNQYLAESRLALARRLLENRVYSTVREVAFAVGFETPHYFSAVYQQRFGRTPGSYLEE